MTYEEYIQYDAVALGAMMREKTISPTEVLEAAIARAEAVNGNINAIIYKMYDTARKQLLTLPLDSVLAGVPFLVKDLELSIAGHPLSSGSRCHRQYVPAVSSYLVEKMLAAGLLIMGKTNTPEMGLTPYTEPELHGPTLNPWNREYSAGGSSGGSGAAVAAGITPIASASDGGGSIRIPASCCGLVGLKPSRGRTTLGPFYGAPWNGAVNNLCLSRTVRDTAAYLDIAQGNHEGDPYFIQKPQGSYLEDHRKDPGSLTIAWSKKHSFGGEVHPECIKGLEKTVALLQQLGHNTVEVNLPWSAEAITYAFFTMVVGETAAEVEYMSRLKGQKPRIADFELNTWLMYKLGCVISSREAALARREWNTLSRTIADFHARYDILLTPTLSRPPIKTGELQNKPAENTLLKLGTGLGLIKWLKNSSLTETLARRSFDYIPFTPIQNMTGQPSMSLPLHTTPDGLPVGMMFSGAMCREDLLLRLAHQIEATVHWKSRWQLPTSAS